MLKILFVYWLLGGCFYITFEVLFNAFFNLNQIKLNEQDKDQNKKLDGKILRYGYTSIWMFIPSSILSLIYRTLFFIPFFSKLYSLLLFMFIVCFTITMVELLFGILFFKITKLRLWDYSDKKLNFKGFICLSHSFFWFLLGLPIWIIFYLGV